MAYRPPVQVESGRRNWGAPQGPALAIRQSVAIVPDVAGEVIDVPVEPNTPMKAGAVLFKIDPVPYEAQVKALEAQFQLQQQRLAQMTQLQRTGSGRSFDVEQRQAFADTLPAGAAGDAAIFTDRVTAAHVIRKVLLRQIAITNYINPF